MNIIKSIFLIFEIIVFSALITINGNFIFSFLVFFGFVILTLINYLIWIYSSNEDHYIYTGANLIKKYLNIDILSE